MESDIFSILKDESYEDNRWTRLIADRLGINVKYLWIAPVSYTHLDVYKRQIYT